MTTVIDIQLALSQAGDNEELAKDLLSMLLKEIPEHRTHLTEALNSKDLDALWEHAHKLYGSTAYCGVPQLRDTSGELEKAIKQADWEQIETNLTAVLQALEQLSQHGAAYLEQKW